MNDMLIKSYKREIKALKEKCDLIDQVGDFNETTVNEYNRSTERIEELESYINDLKSRRFIQISFSYDRSSDLYETNAPDKEIKKAIDFCGKNTTFAKREHDLNCYLQNNGYYAKRIYIDEEFLN